MTALINELSGGSCCGDDCCYKFQLEGCAAGVPYAQVSLITAGATVVKWVNLDTGDMVAVKPPGFVTGDCADAGINMQTCYLIGADKYSVFMVNGVTTYFKNDVLVTGTANIDAAALAVAGATYENIVSCEPEAVPVDAATCYEKTVVVPPVPGTDTFTAQSGFPTIRPMDGSGALAETVYGQEYRTDREEDGQYMLRDGANNHSGSAGNYALAFNFAIGRPMPEKFYGQKLIGTAGTTYKVGYWAKERAANPAGNFRVDVKDGASVIATGTSGPLATTYTNYQSGTFVMPAAGFVTIELYSLTPGSGSGNDPLLDDIGLWETVGGTPGSTTTVTYTKTTLNGVDTYTDENGDEVTGAALTQLLADIAAGVYDVVPCAAGCGCTADDLISTDAGNSLIEGTDGKLYVSAQMLFDNQVLTGDNTTNVTVTLTPTTVTDESGGEQVNYVVKAVTKVDGTTIVEDPTTHVLSAANQKPDVLTTVQPTPAATGNTTNRNTIFKDAAGATWFVDFNGDAIMMGAAVFKEQNRFYVDPNGADTNNGANEAPYLTAAAAVAALTANDVAVLNEGTYAAVTMSVQNTGLVGASGAYSSLSQIAGVTVATASGTSNKISDLTITGNLARTGNAPLYVNNTTVSGNVTLAGTAYTEIRDSSIQDGSITVSGASTLFIEDSKIGSSTFSTAGSVIAMRNVTIDAADCVTIGAGVVYSLQDVVGCVNIDPAAVNAEQAAIAGGLSAAQAEAAVTSNFHHIRMHNADVELNPTQIVTRDPVTGELEVSNISDIIPDACCVPGGGTDGQVLTWQPDGSFTWETINTTINTVDVTTAPAATGNTPGPRFEKMPDGTIYFIDSTGRADAVSKPTLWVDVTTAPSETGNAPGPRYEKMPDGTMYFIDSVGRAEKVLSGCVTRTETETFTATDGQTSFTLANTPIDDVSGSRNGIALDDAAFTVSGDTVTYVPAANNGSLLCAGQRVTISYTWEDCATLPCCDGTQGDAFDPADAVPCDNGTDAFEPTSATCPAVPADAFE